MFKDFYTVSLVSGEVKVEYLKFTKPLKKILHRYNNLFPSSVYTGARTGIYPWC